MVQGAPQTAGRFDEEVRMYKAPPPEVSSEEFYETDPTKPYRRGFSIQNVSPLPITYAEHVAAQGHWGEVLREYMRDYVHWATLGALCEFLPRYDNARHPGRARPTATGCRWPTSPTAKCDNDRQLDEGRPGGPWKTILQAAGAERGHDHRTVRPSGRRLPDGRRRERRRGRRATCGRFAVPNLYITDGSVLPTQGSANPALTIMALAARCADRLIEQRRRGDIRSHAASPA